MISARGDESPCDRGVLDAPALRRSAAGVVGLTLSIGLAACTTTASRNAYFGEVQPPAGQVLRYITGGEPESLDPPVSSGQPEARLYVALFEGLTEFDPRTAAPTPAIAERWDVNADNTEFIFHLRSTARWSNGAPITAHDFVYSLRRALSPAFASRNAYLAYDILYAQGYNEGGVFVRDSAGAGYVPDPADPAHRLVLPGDARARAAALATPALAAARDQPVTAIREEDVGVDAVDDHTLRIRLVRPVPFLVGLVTHQFFRPVFRDVVERYGEQWTQPAHIVTSGPFTLEVWRPYDKIVVRRSPTYWDAAHVRLDEITFYSIEDLTTMMNLYKAGEVDAVYNHTVPAAWIDRVRTFRDYMDAPENSNEYFMLNVTRPPMNDVRVRKAFNMSIDKAALARYLRAAKPLTSFMPEGIFVGYPRAKGDPFDVTRARALLAEAGYRDAEGRYDAARFPIGQLELSYNTNEKNRQVAEFAQAQWKQNLGLTVPLKNVEWKTFLASRSALDYRGIARGAWVGDYLDPFTFLNLFSTPAGDNGTGWWDREFVSMLDAANRQPDAARRFEILARAEQYLLDAQPVIPLFTGATNWLKKPYVKGMYANPLTLFSWKSIYIEHDPSRWDAPEAVR